MSYKSYGSWVNVVSNIWLNECKLLNCTSEKYIFPPQKDDMKETWLEKAVV